MKDDARTTALTILDRLDRQRKTLDLIVDSVLDKSHTLERRDTALTSAIVYGVVRWKARIDWIIGHFSKTPIPGIDTTVMNILRMGVFQITHLSRIPDSAAVNTSVELTKEYAKPHLANFVNGILRNVARGHLEVPFPSNRKDPVYALSKKKSMPVWLLARWIKRHGRAGAEALCDRINTIPSIAVRVNTLKTSRNELFAALEDSAGHVSLQDRSPLGIALDKPEKRISELQTFKDGWFQVQDEAAQLVSFHLNPQPGETVLDACAGLGGKTGHLAQLMENRGSIVALDRDAYKLEKLGVEMDRLGISMVSTLPHDLEDPFQRDVAFDREDAFDWENFGPFDRILLDAPCSGLGVLQRNPDSKWSLQKKNLSRYRLRQLRFLQRVSKLLKPTGSLVYAVCSTEPEENEMVIAEFLEKNGDFMVDTAKEGLSPSAAELMNNDGYIRTFPHLHKMDGFFSVRIIRKPCS